MRVTHCKPVFNSLNGWYCGWGREAPMTRLSHRPTATSGDTDVMGARYNLLASCQHWNSHLLTPIYFVFLQLLLDFLQKVSEHGGNLMPVSNVAMIMAPNLFLTQSGRSKPKSVKEIEFAMAAGTSNIVRQMIQYQEIMWSVSMQSNLHEKKQTKKNPTNYKQTGDDLWKIWTDQKLLRLAAGRWQDQHCFFDTVAS